MNRLARRFSPMRFFELVKYLLLFFSCIIHAYCIATLFIRLLLIFVFRCIDLPACMQILILVRFSHVITFYFSILTVYFNVEFCTSGPSTDDEGGRSGKTFSLARFIFVEFKTDFLDSHWVLQSSLVLFALILPPFVCAVMIVYDVKWL